MLVDFNFRIIFEYLPLFLTGLRSTFFIAVVSIALALATGIIACACRISSIKTIKYPAIAYIEIIRSTPLLVQIYFLYFGLPTLGLRIPELQTGIIALMLNSGAYIAEIIRAGINSVDEGQIEAGISSGLNYVQRMRFIILPQALGVTIPPLLGQNIVLVKDSALLSLISVAELTRCGQTMTSERFMPAEAFLTVAFFYMVIYFCLKALADWSQRKLIFREAY
ncbi:MAG: amino acid ABC transporter permease [Desulfobacula sp.]|uniref:amino acid ABC transporter permease n=1 Tax=Desulfobacula sp. TaxID=2593537 RepID=UPI0025B9AF26|nr:amino acid ABC transporter permease [Desulfobacula sp.]MCD4722811.1 amino acid ABC transporter permease [Desulfobacula sp.]